MLIAFLGKKLGDSVSSLRLYVYCLSYTSSFFVKRLPKWSIYRRYSFFVMYQGIQMNQLDVTMIY